LGLGLGARGRLTVGLGGEVGDLLEEAEELCITPEHARRVRAAAARWMTHGLQGRVTVRVRLGVGVRGGRGRGRNSVRGRGRGRGMRTARARAGAWARAGARAGVRARVRCG